MSKRIAVFLINITGNISEIWNNSFQTCFLQKYEFCRHKKGKKHLLKTDPCKTKNQSCL